ncbi:hypothetical protein CH373_01415 [Leptospira perolatii]|uniref:Response regulatory domain-containing protein n=1 Tax=Leptospira perolatii TaxID=2023191 RepID=A0A2M9ZRN9_9LEPT|nr:response regulator [Leptospira perolatii]PJZ71199.1 hypothetical protein CH360_01415 [Leptospira perolatii]PJZ74732.1 hypothetical protein CH373_01415 [Leptospira perolatii]
MNSSSKFYELLLVDDDSIFVALTRRTMEKAGVAGNLRVFGDGEGAITYLKSVIADLNLIPDVIFLDINMPYMDGWQFLDEYSRFAGELSKQPIIYMVSSSVDEADIRKAKEIPFVKGYLVKPLSVDAFRGIFSVA